VTKRLLKRNMLSSVINMLKKGGRGKW